MNQHNIQLEEALLEQLQWHKARVKFVALFIIALVKVCTVNFVKVANGLSGKAKNKSSYRRNQRFFQAMRSTIIMLPESFNTCCLRKVILSLPLTEPTGNLGRVTSTF
jgi:hypothetical protein